MSRAYRAAAALLGALALVLAPGASAARSAAGYDVSLVKDVNPAGAIAPMGVVAAAGTLYFDADDGVHGAELWRSDGTAAGTTLTRDIVPGAVGSNPTHLTAVGTTLFFGADGELWKSDGTTAGTVAVKDIPLPPSFIPGAMVALGDTALLAAGGPSFTDDQLWRSDGTTAGTVIVKQIVGGGDVSQLTVLGSSVVFRAYDPAHGYELWRSDGTEAGTSLVKDIWPGPDSSLGGRFIRVGDQLLFSAVDGPHGYELWRTDGTTAGTTKVASLDMYSAAVVGSTLFFAADDGVHGRELWRTDGTPGGTALVKDVNPGGSSRAELLVSDGSTVYFAADDGVHGEELWRSGGAAGDTWMVKDINPAGGASPLLGAVVDGELFFTADDGVHGSELWRSNGWGVGTAMVADIRAGADGSVPVWFAGVGSTLFFTADDGPHGNELWKASVSAPLPPAIAGIWPAAGLAGGTVTVTGANFAGATAVKLNGASAAFTVLADTRLTLTVPGGATSGPITVTTPAGTATSARPFVVVEQPSIDSFAPTSAHVHQTVTVHGAHFTGTTSVAIGAVPVPFTVVSDTTITFTVPPGATDGQVVVTNPAGSDSLGGLTVLPPPTITGFTPSAGPVGTLVTVTGTGLDGAVGVMLGSVLTVPTSSGDTEVAFRVPPGAATGHIKVLTTTGSVTSAGVFTVTS